MWERRENKKEKSEVHATKAGAHLAEQGMQSLKEMKRAMMISEKKMGNKELE